MSSALRNRSVGSKSENGRAAIVAAAALSMSTAPAPSSPSADVKPIPPVVVPLANRSGADIFAEMSSFAANPVCTAAAGLLSATGGDTGRALKLIGDGAPLAAELHRAAALRTVLTKTAPRDCFDGEYHNPHGARIGDLYANTLGLSSLYRADSRGALKDARSKARPLIVKAK